MEICLIDIVSCTLLDVAVMCVALWMLNREWQFEIFTSCCKYLYGNSCYYGYYWNPGYNLERYFRRFLR